MNNEAKTTEMKVCECGKLMIKRHTGVTLAVYPGIHVMEWKCYGCGLTVPEKEGRMVDPETAERAEWERINGVSSIPYGVWVLNKNMPAVSGCGFTTFTDAQRKKSKKSKTADVNIHVFVHTEHESPDPYAEDIRRGDMFGCAIRAGTRRPKMFKRNEQDGEEANDV